MSSRIFPLGVALLALLLAGCSNNNPFEDLDEFMADKRSKPAGTVKPLPPVKAYKSFAYSASGMRSPFERPVEAVQIAEITQSAVVAPDEDRLREYLEEFSLDSLRMVGAMVVSGERWALIRDGAGGVHRVRRGNYLGRNHGRIVELGETHVAIIEIVKNGEQWIERPRTIELRVTDN